MFVCGRELVHAQILFYFFCESAHSSKEHKDGSEGRGDLIVTERAKLKL